MELDGAVLGPGTGGGDAAPGTNLKTVFAGLMLGMLLAAVSQTIIAPAMPRIVAELGGMAHYSWIAVSTLLASTVVVPIVGKLSDLYGRKAFYVGGIVVFMISSLIAALAHSFGTFIIARVVEGLGMGTMMPLSQAIIGDLIPPRERGRYQGYMGAVFGLASVIGPLVGGYLTDNLTWRWLFLINLPVGLIALGFVVPFMHLPKKGGRHSIDYAGFVTLTLGLTTVLLATVWGGTTYPWGSPQIIGMFAGGALLLGVFVAVETRAAEPVIPLRLWKNPIFTWANLANMAVAMGMFGAIYFIPVFVQGVIGTSVTSSGAVLTPLMVSLVIMSALNGQVITRTGHYKLPVLIGIALIGTGFVLLTQMDRHTTRGTVMRDMVLIGMGLGMSMQTFVLVVQNAVARADLGVATATTQLFRSIGSSAGIAILGTVMTQGMARELPRHLGSAAGALRGAAGGEVNAGAVLDPAVMSRLPPAVLEGIREALAAALHPVFVAGLPFIAVAFLAALMIREIPLRRTAGAGAGEAGREVLAELGQAGAGDREPELGVPNPAYRERAGFLGVVLALAAQSGDGAPGGRVRALLERVGGGDAARGRERLRAASLTLLRECEGEDADELVARIEQGAPPPLGGMDPLAELERALSQRPPELAERLRAAANRTVLDGTAALTPADLDALERIGIAASAAALLDGREKSTEC